MWTLLKTAVAFLTRLPVAFAEAPPILARAAFAFPLVGLLVGGFGAAVLLAGERFGLPPLAGALLALAGQALMTGGLHEDGLADVADGFGGGATPERKLEIMRDSRIGSYGVLAVVFSVTLRAAALAGIGPAAAALVAAGAASRGFLPLLMRTLPAVRSDGLGKGAGEPTALGTAAAVALGLGISLAALGLHGLEAWLAGMLAAAALAAIARAQVGGQTGDVLGAAQQVSEIAFLLTLAALA